MPDEKEQLDTSPNTPTHRTQPDHNDTGWPGGVPYIIGNEGCERFSFYGIKSILQIFHNLKK